MENSDSEYEIEETVVLLELNGIIDADFLLQQQSVTKILGIDTDEPLLQIGNCLFKGQYEDTLGTVALYEPLDESQKDGSESIENSFKFLCKTDTKLAMKRCFPQERSTDNLKSTEVSPPVAIQNDQPIAASDMITTNKKKIIHKEKKLKQPIPKKLQKPKKNTKGDQISSAEKISEETISESEQLTKNIPAITDAPPSKPDTIAADVEKRDQINPAHSESTKSPNRENKIKVTNKRKRNHDEANGDTLGHDQNLEFATAQKKLMKMKEDNAQVADTEMETYAKENEESNNSDSERNNAVLSGTETFVSEMHERDEQMIEEEIVMETLVSTVISNESELQKTTTTAFSSETRGREIMTEESNVKTYETVVTNDASETSTTVLDMEENKKPLTDEECIPITLSNTVGNNESNIQEENTVSNVLKNDEEPLIEEEKMVEAVDIAMGSNESKVQDESTFTKPSEIDQETVIEQERIIEAAENGNEIEIQGKCTLVNGSEIKRVKLLIAEDIANTMENIVGNVESEIQQKSESTSQLEMDENEEIVIEENVKILSDTISYNENIIHVGSTHLNFPDVGSAPLAEKTNEICSSSGDMEKISNEGISEQADVCESFDDTMNLYERTKQDDDASLSCQENEESMALGKNIVEESNVDETVLNTGTDNMSELISVEKNAICVKSQSANVEANVSSKLDESESHYISAGEYACSNLDNLSPVSASDMINLPTVGEILVSNTRKHSSCEVTQSMNSEGQYSENKNLASEFEVFYEPQQHDNLENIVAVEKDEQLPAAQVEDADLPLESESIELEISQESKFSEENPQAKFEAEGAICSQSTDQLVILPEIQSEVEDLCVSSCDFADKSEFKENIEKNKCLNAVEDVEQLNCEESDVNIVCEVSQSDESENNVTIFAESPESKVLSTGSHSCTDESMNNASTKQLIVETNDCIQEAVNIPSTSSNQEVTQSCSVKDVTASDLHPEKNDDESKYDCVSSVDVSAVSATLLKSEADTDKKDPNSEFGQSFGPTENQHCDKTSKTSHSKLVKDLEIEQISAEFEHSGEVSQSVELESLTPLQSDNELDRTEPSSDFATSFSNYSVQCQSDICESSVDESNIGSHSPVESIQLDKNSMCEVSQSSKSEETILTIIHSTDSEIESLNECEVYAPCVEPEAETRQRNSSEKNICESSDDVTEIESEKCFDQPKEMVRNICESSDDVCEIESEIITGQISDSRKNICESSDDVNEIESEIITHQINEKEQNICESSDDVNEIESEIINDQINERAQNLCESSDDINEYEIIIDQASESEKNICESSGDVNETESEIIIDLISDSGKNVCESSDDVNETESVIIIDQISDSGKNLCESSCDVNETESEIIIDQISESGKNLCESSDDVNETESEIIIDQISDSGKNICESSGDVNETESEIVIDQISNSGKNVCESSVDVNETESEIIIDQISESEKNVCESSDDVNETESEIIIDQINALGKNICESSDDVNETESEIIIDQINAHGKNICESSDDVNETESEIIIEHISDEGRNICESSDDISKKFGSIQQLGSIQHEENISEEVCQSSKVEENLMPGSETEVLPEENFTECGTSSVRSNIKNSTICESSGDTIGMGPGDLDLNAGACTSSGKSIIESADAAGNILDSESFVSVGEMENNQISQSSNVASGCMKMSVNGTENSIISQSGSTVNIAVYQTLNESENCQISQSGGYLEGVSVIETEGEISQSGGIAGTSNVVTLNETENSQISQSGCFINSLSNVAVEEIENDQISQSENTVGHMTDSFVTEVENNQISQSGNNENASSEVALNEIENNQISQSGNIASCPADMSIPETENSLISQSGSVPGYSNNASRMESENSQISQSSSNTKEFLYDATLNESYNNQISQSSSSSNLSSNVMSREMGNNQISQSGNSVAIVSETENNQISQSSSSGGTLNKESENYQISQSSNSCVPLNVLSNESENNQISQSECNDNIYELNQTLPIDSNFQAEVVNISSSSDVVSSNYIDVTNSFYVSNSAISSNSEVNPSIGNVHSQIWDRNVLVTSVTTSEMRTSVLSSEEIESQLAVSSCSVIIAGDGEDVTFVDQEMSSSSNINEVVESSLSLIHEKDETNKLAPKDDSLMNVSGSILEEMPSTSQNLNRSDDDRIQNTETESSRNNLRGEDFQPSVSGISLIQKPFEFDSNLLQTSAFLPRVSSQTGAGNSSSSARPSFLEVMASSASDFRNSLLSDNSFGKDKSHASSAPESSASNIGSCGEFSESFIREADGLVQSRSSDNITHAPDNLPTLTDNSNLVHSEVPRSAGIKRKYCDSGEFGYSHQQVSQSSDVVNTLPSTSKTHALISDNISQSSQQDFVQSSSNILRPSVLISNDSLSVIDQVSSADENTSFVNKDSEIADISESSIGVEAALPSCSQNTFSLASSNQLIESSSDQPTFTEDVFTFKSENTESEVSSTPSETQYTGFKVLTEGKEQFASLQGGILILPGTSNIIDESDADITTVEVTSPDSDYVPAGSNINSEAVLILDSSNEAEILNRSSVLSPMAVQLASFDRRSLVDASHGRFASSASGSPISEVECVSYEESSEVSESQVTNQNDISQSSLGDNNVSCSVSEFSASHRAINPSCSFPDISQEAESKSSDDCISSYHSTCDNILPVPNLQSSADREFYSHVGEFDDSVQSSLDETHLAINEQIKAISSPPNSSDSASCDEQRSLSINPFVTFSSQSHVFSSNYGATSSKITLCSNSASEIELERDNLIEDSPQVITTTSNIIMSSFDPELTNMSESPQNSRNVCSPEQYVELSEQIVPAVQIPGADFVESSSDQLDDSQSVENIVSQNVLNTDPES